MPGKKTTPSRVPKNAVLLSDVASLTLYDGKRTASRRVSPLPQLECIGARDVCKLYKVDVMRCVNEGADYDADNIQWSCKASLPEEFKLGSTDVVCEGYESSDDPYILKGSCAVEYRLLLTRAGERKYGKAHHKFKWDPPTINVSTGNGPGTGISVLFFMVFFIVLFIILRGIWSRWNDDRPSTRGDGGPTRRYGGYDDDGNDNDDPPPPYDGPPSYSSQPKKANSRTSTRRPTAAAQGSSPRTGSQRQPQRWRPGFWTGAATGAAAAYWAGSRNQARSESRPETQERQRGGFFSNFGPQRESWTRSSPPRAPQSMVSASSSSSSFSTTRHESTGFGSTRRR